MTFLISSARSAIRMLNPGDVPTCMVCSKAVRTEQRRIELRGGLVHRECATYRVRNRLPASGGLDSPR